MKNIFLFFILSTIGISFSQSDAELLNKAEAALAENNYKEAHKAIDKAILINDTIPYYHSFKADIYIKQKDYQAAYEVLNLMVKKMPKNTWAYNYRGNFLMNLNEVELAMNDFFDSNNYTNNDTLKYSNLGNIATMYIINREFEKGYNMLMDCYKFDTTSVTTLTNLANVCGDLNKNDDAIYYLNSAISLKPDFIPLYTNLGFLYQSMEKHENAIANFNIAIENDPNDAYALNNRSYSYLKLGRIKEALKDVDKSIKLNPTNSYAYKNRALIYIQSKKFDAACEDIQTAINYEFVKFYGEEILDLKKKYCN